MEHHFLEIGGQGYARHACAEAGNPVCKEFCASVRQGKPVIVSGNRFHRGIPWMSAISAQVHLHEFAFIEETWGAGCPPSLNNRRIGILPVYSIPLNDFRAVAFSQKQR
jgi:hypothetical protein